MTDATMSDLHERLAAVRTNAARAAQRTPAQAAALLAARAGVLARPIAAEGGADGATLPVLVFQVGDEQIGMPLDSIVAIARIGMLAPLPRAVRPVFGVTAWRGRPLTVLSLSRERPVLGADTRLLVLGTGARAALAVIVDAVDEVRDVHAADLTPSGAGPRRAYTLGITPDGLLVIDGATLLQPESLAL